MNYNEYIAYHLRGDASVEENFTASYIKAKNLSEWDAFRFLYYYAVCYHLPSAMKMLRRPNISKNEVFFRTDRRYVRIGGRYEKVMSALHKDMLIQLCKCKTTLDQYKYVSTWFYFGRYAAYLFLECFFKLCPCPEDNLMMRFDPHENYTKGAVIISGCRNQEQLDAFIRSAKRDTGDNVFSLETSLCAVEKIRKGTRWDGFYTERLMQELIDSNLSGYLGLVK